MGDSFELDGDLVDAVTLLDAAVAELLARCDCEPVPDPPYRAFVTVSMSCPVHGHSGRYDHYHYVEVGTWGWRCHHSQRCKDNFTRDCRYVAWAKAHFPMSLCAVKNDWYRMVPLKDGFILVVDI